VSSDCQGVIGSRYLRIAASGLMNAGLPPLFFIRSSPAVNISDTPKSQSLTCVRSALSRTLSGCLRMRSTPSADRANLARTMRDNPPTLISRCVTPAECKYSRPRVNWRKYDRAFSISSDFDGSPPTLMSISVPPGTYSRTRYSESDVLTLIAS